MNGEDESVEIAEFAGDQGNGIGTWRRKAMTRREVGRKETIAEIPLTEFGRRRGKVGKLPTEAVGLGHSAIESMRGIEVERIEDDLFGGLTDDESRSRIEGKRVVDKKRIVTEKNSVEGTSGRIRTDERGVRFVGLIKLEFGVFGTQFAPHTADR